MYLFFCVLNLNVATEFVYSTLNFQNKFIRKKITFLAIFMTVLKNYGNLIKIFTIRILF